MKKTLQKAIESKDIGQVRTIITQCVTSGPMSRKDIELVQYAIANTPGLFEKDNGAVYPRPEAMTPADREALEEALTRNFSEPKFQLLTETALLPEEKPAKKKAKGEPEPEKFTLAETIEIEAAKGPTAAVCSLPGRPEKKSVKTFGYILMALGVASIVTGICVPANFLLGLGIVVFLLASALVYFTIKAGNK